MAELDRDAPAAQAEIETRTDPGGAPVIAVSGELDMSNAGKLEEIVDAAVAAKPDRLVFDLSGLRFMDSAGIAVLLGAAGKVPTIELRDPSPPVRRVVELTGLESVLSVAP
jgi:anti-sigma B factor antagonist